MEPGGTRGGRGVARPGASGTIALLAFRISRALERPLILRRLEKPEIKKGICVDIRVGGGTSRTEKRPAAALGTGSARSIHPGALLLPIRVFWELPRFASH